MANNTMENVSCLDDLENAGSQGPLAVKKCEPTQEEPADDTGNPNSKEVVIHEDAAEDNAERESNDAVVASVASTVTECLEEDEGEGDNGEDEDEHEDEDADDQDNDDELFDVSEARPEMSVDMSGHPDNEVERHDAAVDTKISPEAMTEASRTALFRRYSKMTPSELERSFHEETLHDHSSVMQHSSVCPEPTAQSCQNPACADQISWRDARIAELQAALDHMTEAMAIQQRDMASQRVYLSRQAEQLTNLSNKLHQEKVALHVERERFQQSIALTPMAIANKLKPAAGKLKSPVKKIFSAAANRRASFTTVTAASSAVHHASSVSTVSLDAANRSNSSSQLRHNPLFSDPATAPLVDRSVSLSALEFRATSKPNVIAITPPKASLERAVSLTAFIGTDSALMVDIGLSPQKSVVSSAATEPQASTLDADFNMRRTDREESVSSQSSDQKKLSIGERFRSIRWGRS